MQAEHLLGKLIVTQILPLRAYKSQPVLENGTTPQATQLFLLTMETEQEALLSCPILANYYRYKTEQLQQPKGAHALLTTTRLEQSQPHFPP